MLLLAAFLFLISGTLGIEEKSCNAIVQPLLGLLDKCQTKHLNFSELKDNLSEVQNRLTEVNLKYSELLEKHLESQDKCTDVALKYAEVQEKFQQTHQELRKSQESLQETTLKYDQVQDKFNKVNIENEELRKKDLQLMNLETQLLENNVQIKLLNDKILNLEKTSELKELNSLKKVEEKSEDPINEEKTIYNITSEEILNNKDTNTTTSPSNSETPIRVLPDGCPTTQEDTFSIPEIQIPGLEPFKVTCYSDRFIGSGWMKVQYRISRSRKFNRTYEQYINGFGDLLDEMFIGLEKLHILTNWKPHEVYLYHFGRDLRCDTFVVGDNSEGYSLKKLEECTGDIPHYNLIQGTKFSTYDRDEDGNPDKNWAKELRFGWWFSSEETDFQKDTASFNFFIRRKD